MPTGYLVGAFDVIGVLDLDAINQLREQGFRIVVGLLDDDEVLRLYGQPPLIPFDERWELVDHVRWIDEVMAHDGANAQRRGWAPFALDGEPLPVGYEATTRLIPRCVTRSARRRPMSDARAQQAVA